MGDSVIPDTAQHYVECGTFTCIQYSKYYCLTCHQRSCEQCTLEHLRDPRKKNHEVVLYRDRLNFLPDNSQFNLMSHQVNRSLTVLDDPGTPDTAQHYVECDIYACTRYSKFYCKTCYQGLCEQCKIEHMKNPWKINHDIVLYQNRMCQMPHISEVMYVEMCRKIGTQTEVSVRRDMLYLAEMMQKSLDKFKTNGSRSVRTGGESDGFEITSSDTVDYMSWQCDHRVICDFSQTQFYHPPKDTLIYMDTSHSPPGFARLELLTESLFDLVNSSLLNINNAVYISASLFKSVCLNRMYESNLNFERVIIQGPGLLFSFPSSNDLNRVHSFHSCHWPSAATPWIGRSLTHKWPSRTVLQSILNEGCHLVPIGSKQSVDFNELEWRLSLPSAEQKLVYSMNHVQFICYGLLKIFAKEIICDELICSYFMKTILFWRIQNDPSNLWTASSLLQHFWKCYKFLMHSVYTENLPNFFIPENNMFAAQVIGQKKLVLFKKLQHFYQMGVACLLQSPSLREMLYSAFCNPLLMVQTEESHIKSETDLDIACFKEIDSRTNLEFNQFWQNTIKLNTIDKLLKSYGNFVLQKIMAEVLIATAMSLKFECLFFTCTNRKRYYDFERTIIHLLDLASKIGYISDILYLALYLYDRGKYNLVLSVMELTKQKLTQGHIMYNGEVGQRMYSEVVCGKSPSAKLRRHWARDITINVEFPYIDELILEQQISLMNGISTIQIPPLVASHMLCVLCHYKQGNRSKYLESLGELRTLLICDKGVYVPLHLRDISWQILGICQNVVGELDRAIESYMESIQQNEHHKIKKASEIRIDEVCKRL